MEPGSGQWGEANANFPPFSELHRGRLRVREAMVRFEALRQGPISTPCMTSILALEN